MPVELARQSKLVTSHDKEITLIDEIEAGHPNPIEEPKEWNAETESDISIRS
jgi:hypothetical protein